MAEPQVRLARKQDVNVICSLVREFAVYVKMTEECLLKDEEMEEALFKLPPFQGPTALLLEVSDAPESEHLFRSPLYPDRVVAGHILFFPKFSSFSGNRSFYIEDLYVRQAHRKKGLGTALLRAVADHAAKQGAGSVDWCVLDWNVNAIKFYQAMGANVLPQWRVCRLTLGCQFQGPAA